MEVRRIRKGTSNTAHGQMECAVDANPTAEEGAILKREWWRIWPNDWIPTLHHVIQSYDTAFLKKETADYSAITTWGVFYPS